jgi:hypothetical protein
VAEALSGAAEGIPMRSDRARRLASKEKKKKSVGNSGNNKAKDCSVVFLDQGLRKRREMRGERAEVRTRRCAQKRINERLGKPLLRRKVPIPGPRVLYSVLRL